MEYNREPINKLSGKWSNNFNKDAKTAIRKTKSFQINDIGKTGYPYA
jgi:hypothetical protein